MCDWTLLVSDNYMCSAWMINRAGYVTGRLLYNWPTSCITGHPVDQPSTALRPVTQPGRDLTVLIYNRTNPDINRSELISSIAQLDSLDSIPRCITSHNQFARCGSYRCLRKSRKIAMILSWEYFTRLLPWANHGEILHDFYHDLAEHGRILRHM